MHLFNEQGSQGGGKEKKLNISRVITFGLNTLAAKDGKFRLLLLQPLTAKNKNFCFFNNLVMHVTILPFSSLAAKVLILSCALKASKHNFGCWPRKNLLWAFTLFHSKIQEKQVWRSPQEILTANIQKYTY